jgi:hypothetical protein
MLDQTAPDRYDSARRVRPLALFRRVSFTRSTMTTHRILALVFILALVLVSTWGGPNFGAIDPTPLGKYEDGYFLWLTNGGFPGGSCLLFTSAGIVNEIPPVTDSEALTSAARRAGFLSFARWTLPDGRDVVAWRRDSDLCQKK